jgi:2-polyprenyl-6-methoxyphenol hydroxylase-like FAD-dependent oxidoreductase
MAFVTPVREYSAFTSPQLEGHRRATALRILASAGCAAAMLLGREGLKVALLEAHRDVNHYKRLCTHSMRTSVLPTLRRLGLDEVFEDRGAVRQHEDTWTQYGWIRGVRPDWLPSHGYNVSRRVMDPIMRTTAAAVPGVELMLGARVTDLTFDRSGRVDGVVASIDGSTRRIGAKLVVGADGFSSKVAQLASLPGRSSPTIDSATSRSTATSRSPRRVLPRCG